MANRRMLAINIRQSKKLAKLKTDFARLAWSWAIPFTDDYGRFEADPDVFKATIFPLIKSATIKKIVEALNDCASVNLIKLYQKEDSFYGEIVDFDRFQTFKTGRTRKAEHPIPDQQDYISGIQWNPLDSIWNAKLVLREENLKELKRSSNQYLSRLQEAFPIYLDVDDDYLNLQISEFSNANANTVLGDLLAWEKKNKKPTEKACLRLRNFFKTAASNRGQVKNQNDLSNIAEGFPNVS